MVARLLGRRTPGIVVAVREQDHHFACHEGGKPSPRAGEKPLTLPDPRLDRLAPLAIHPCDAPQDPQLVVRQRAKAARFAVELNDPDLRLRVVRHVEFVDELNGRSLHMLSRLASHRGRAVHDEDDVQRILRVPAVRPERERDGHVVPEVRRLGRQLLPVADALAGRHGRRRRRARRHRRGGLPVEAAGDARRGRDESGHQPGNERRGEHPGFGCVVHHWRPHSRSGDSWVRGSRRRMWRPRYITRLAPRDGHRKGGRQADSCPQTGRHGLFLLIASLARRAEELLPHECQAGSTVSVGGNRRRLAASTFRPSTTGCRGEACLAPTRWSRRPVRS